MRRSLLLCLLPLGLALAARADWPRLPPVEGELAGKLTWSTQPLVPAMDWRITVQSAADGRRRAELVAAAEGAQVRAHADLDAVTGDGSWQIDAGELDAARWFSVVAEKLGDPFGAAEVSGKVSVTGEGALRGGVPRGLVELTLSGGRLTLAKSKLEFTGLALRVRLPRLPVPAVEGDLTFAAGRAADAKAGEVMAAENGDRETVYAALAKQTGTSAEQVGRARAKQIAAASAAGVWLQREDGTWHKK